MSSPLPPLNAPLLVAGFAGATWITSEGEVESLDLQAAAARARGEMPLLCHLPNTAQRLGSGPFRAYDLLELYAFVRPATFAVPTPRGLADALGLAPPARPEDAAMSLKAAARALLAELAARPPAKTLKELAWSLAKLGWSWGPAVVAALEGQRALEPGAARGGFTGAGFDIWERLPLWEEEAPPPPPGQQPVSAEAARRRLAALLGEASESRPEQADYASAVAQAFRPREEEGLPHYVLAEAGTGVGKTLGYIAPASLWAEQNETAVWISTYTRNLQHQVDGELDRLYPQAAEKRRQVVVRKGRENYLCLLNLKEAVAQAGFDQARAIALGLMVRWAEATRDGDMVGSDFPGWLVGLLGPGPTLGLTDRRGECLYSACPHYGRCFIEHSQRRAKHARIVVANHALVLIRAALEGGEEGQLPSHVIFDEGHHLFAAADSAFAAHLSGEEGQDLRRWILGGEGGKASRRRGLERRAEDLLPLEAPEPSAHEAKDQSESSADLLQRALVAARALPGEGWRQRLADGQPRGPAESFLAALRGQVYARAGDNAGGYGLECPTRPLTEEVAAPAAALDKALQNLSQPLRELGRRLARRLDAEADELESDQRRRIEALCRGIERRAVQTLLAWQEMLRNLTEPETPEAFCDWFAVERLGGRERDVGYFRHWVDPMRPFAETVLAHSHGVVTTSATLTDRSGDSERDWSAAEATTGARHLPDLASRIGAHRGLGGVLRARVPSPFDYPALTRIFVVGDVARDAPDQVAAAYRTLFLAAGGGALGLFTAIARLRAVQERIGPALEEAGLTLLAQHVDPMDTATLVDIFRAEPQSCLLGTDAVRDGVDVPGAALRLIVFDRVPWPRPSLQHKARRKAFGGRDYDDRLARFKLRQAYGRLVRRADDRGVFVILDSRLPSRLLTAFPEGVEVRRVGLAEAVAETGAFLGEDAE